jgi:hypothetical protein
MSGVIIVAVLVTITAGKKYNVALSNGNIRFKRIEVFVTLVIRTVKGGKVNIGIAVGVYVADIIGALDGFLDETSGIVVGVTEGVKNLYEGWIVGLSVGCDVG